MHSPLLTLFSSTITIGFVTADHGDSRVIGKARGSIGYLSDGTCAAEGLPVVPYGPTFAFGDLIGCGVNHLTNEVREPLLSTCFK